MEFLEVTENIFDFFFVDLFDLILEHPLVV
jgi:hypothetical protein